MPIENAFSEISSDLKTLGVDKVVIADILTISSMSNVGIFFTNNQNISSK